MTTDTRDELIPLRTGFDQVWHGYDRGQVHQYMQSVETELRLLAADRNGTATQAEELTRQLEQARDESRQLREQVARITRSPIDPETLTERLRHMLELAQAEADEILMRARAGATNMQTAARQADDQRRRRHDRLVAELEARRQEMEAEHRDVLRKATEQAERTVREATEQAERTTREASEQAERMTREATEYAERTTRDADERRRELDEADARRRAQVNSDFDIAMAARRADAEREIDERTTAARRTADRMVRDAKREVEQLNNRRDEVATALAGTLALLADAQSVLLPRSPDGTRPSAAA
jgi:cell division septum initiation protein DivIVA